MQAEEKISEEVRKRIFEIKNTTSDIVKIQGDYIV
jgi:hypothetical protein